MVKKSYAIAIAAPIVLVVIVASILDSGILEQPERIENIKIEVIYPGPWESVLYNNEDMQRIEGFTKKTIIIFRPSVGEWVLTFNAQKKDDSPSQMKVMVKTIDGSILGEAVTTERFGKIHISLELG